MKEIKNIRQRIDAIEDDEKRAMLYDKLADLSDKLQDYIDNYDKIQAQKKANMKIVK